MFNQLLASNFWAVSPYQGPQTVSGYYTDARCYLRCSDKKFKVKVGILFVPGIGQFFVSIHLANTPIRDNRPSAWLTSTRNGARLTCFLS